LLYDDAQSIYSKKKQLDFSLSSVGIQARGRTTVLKLNYRNTEEILTFAYRFATNYLKVEDKDEDHVPLIEPHSAGRHGPKPAVKLHADFQQEVRYIARIFRRMHDELEIPWEDFCVTYRTNWMGDIFQKVFRTENIPFQWLGTSKAKKGLKMKDQSVKLMTMHSSKGLEFPIVAVSGIGDMPIKNTEPADEAKLLYVAMTRATEKLLVTSHKENEFFQQLQKME
jgi:superfamily I DNA/RNA helicase